MFFLLNSIFLFHLLLYNNFVFIIFILLEIYTKSILSFRVILDADPASVVKRVDLRNDDMPIAEQTVVQVIKAIQESFW